MRKILLAIGILLGSIVAASAQCTGVFPNNTACGNVSGSASPPYPIPTSNIIPSGTVIGPQACTANEWISSLNSSGAIVCTQPSFSNINGTATIAQGGTGATSASGAFSNLAPAPTRAGDVMYWNGTAWVTLAGNNSSTQVFTENSSGVPSWSTAGSGTITAVVAGYGMTGGGSSGSVTLTFAPCPPSPCTIISTTATTCNNGGSAADDGVYTTPTCQGQLPLYIEAKLVGGGAGGGGGNNSSAGTSGNPTCLSTSSSPCTSPVYEAGGGGSPASGTNGTGGTTSGSGTFTESIPGAPGGAGSPGGTAYGTGGNGGNSCIGGGAGTGPGSTNNGVAGATNTGGGGGGGGTNTSESGWAGGGGGGGACGIVIITSPASTYYYSIAGTAAGGSAGTGGGTGGAGAAGRLTLTSRWQ